MTFPKRLSTKLENRIASDALRNLSHSNDFIDFSSNDYLGFAQSTEIYEKALAYDKGGIAINGATGSRLLSGNSEFHEEVELQLAKYFHSDAALLFNSGYDANIGLLSAILQRGDIIFYDELVHASIRDGIQMSPAKSVKFQHNNLNDLETKLQRHSQLVSKSTNSESYLITESVFSMDGDSPHLKALIQLCTKYRIHLIIDEAHATGVFGNKGEGLLQALNLQNKVFARVHTFGKALGCHGAVILGSKQLQNYLINYARSFIYTTAMPLHTVATIKASIELLSQTNNIKKLNELIIHFNEQLDSKYNHLKFVQSNSAIHSCIIPGNTNVKQVAEFLQKKGYDIKPILSPTVQEGQERLRICLHSFNSIEEINHVLELLTTILKTIDYD
ncbi:pyridoxal phosphate-dependent aminotransferase family protein [Urechidicola sp. KH5]